MPAQDIGEPRRDDPTLAASLQGAVESSATSARESVASLDKSRHESERLITGLDATTNALVDRLDAMRDVIGTPPKRAYAGSATVAGGLALLAIGGVSGLALNIRQAPPAEAPSHAEKLLPAPPVPAPAAAPAGTAQPAATIAAGGSASSKAGSASPAVAQPAPSGAAVEVRRGDSLSRIAARRHLPLDRVIAANPQIKDPNRLLIGQHVSLPDQ